MRAGWIALALAVLVAWLLALVWVREPPVEDVSPRAEGGSDEVQADVAVAPQIKPSPPVHRPEPVGEDEAPPSHDGHGSEHPEGPGILMGRAFAEQGRDAAWASPAEASLQAAFEQSGIDMRQLVKVECRQTLCRLELIQHFGDEALYSELFKGLGDQFGDTPTYEMLAPRGPKLYQRLNVYLPKPGFARQDYTSAAPD